MIVTVAELKTALGIDELDVSQDAYLEQLIVNVGAWIQEQTHQYFDTPVARTEILEGSGERKLYLPGHVDESQTLGDESADLAALVAVRERLIGEGKNDWTDLEEDTDWERRKDALVRIGSWPCWLRNSEYEIQFMDGWVSAPPDIKALVIELASGQYGADQANADGTAGIASEKLGDYSYTLGDGVGTSAGTAGGGMISDTGLMTLNRWRKPSA
jgi:hypothetical protein